MGDQKTALAKFYSTQPNYAQSRFESFEFNYCIASFTPRSSVRRHGATSKAPSVHAQYLLHDRAIKRDAWNE
jgi:hypothetical protein